MVKTGWLIGLMFLGLLTSRSAAQSGPLTEDISIAKINKVRARHGAQPLTRNSKLDSAAAMQLKVCVKMDDLTHFHPDRKLREVHNRVVAIGYDYRACGENILYFSTDGSETEEELAKQMVQQWVDSRDHYENILDKDYTQTGLAIAWSEDGSRLYAIQVFARPATVKYAQH